MLKQQVLEFTLLYIFKYRTNTVSLLDTTCPFHLSFLARIITYTVGMQSRNKRCSIKCSPPSSHCINFVVLMPLRGAETATVHCRMSTWTRKKSLPSVSNPGFGHVTCAGLGRFEVWSDGRRGNGSCPQETNRKGPLMVWQAGRGRPVAGSALSGQSASIDRSANSSLHLLVKKATSMKNSVCCCCSLQPFNDFILT